MFWLSIGFGFFAVAVLATILPRWLWGSVKRQQQVFESSSEQFFASRFVFIKGKAFVNAGMVGVFLLCVLLWLSTQSIAAVCFLLCTFLIAWPIVIRRLRLYRIKQIEKQFPDFLFALASALKAGSSLAIALQRISPLTTAPLQQELALALKEQRMGLSLAETIERFQQRLPCEATLLFNSAIAVAGHSGGAIAELLEQIALTIQQRLHIEQRIHTLTAQGRMQAWVMLCVPFLVAAALYIVDPLLISPLWQQTSGRLLLLVIFGLELMGYWMIRRIVAITI